MVVCSATVNCVHTEKVILDVEYDVGNYSRFFVCGKISVFLFFF